MNQWYCREPISSTQAASRLVFNIDNCVDMTRVIYARPPRPPDSVGRECYVYVLDGSCVRNIRDLPIDDLAPWNSKMCKSSTRFNAITVNPQRGDMLMRRYIVSDTNNVPECLLACYYCKHPTFKLAKKIFYACDGRREACLPGTFVVFIYEFDGQEKLYQRSYMNGSANRHHHSSGPRRIPHDKSIKRSVLDSIPSLVSQHQQNSNQNQQPFDIGHDISQTRFALEAICGGASSSTATSASDLFNTTSGLLSTATSTVGANCSATTSSSINSGNGSTNGIHSPHLSSTPPTNDLDETLQQLLSGESKLNELFYSQLLSVDNASQQAKLRPAPPNFSATTGLSSSRRRKFSTITGQRIDSIPSKLQRIPFHNAPLDFRAVVATEAMLENFTRSGLCEVEALIEFCDKFADDPTSVDIHALELGGCVLLSATIPLEQPALHPVAILVSTKVAPDDSQFLLSELQSRLGKTRKIARAILSPESVNLCLTNGDESSLFSYPCIRLNCSNDFRTSIERRFGSGGDATVDARVLEDDLFGAVNSDRVEKSTGLLNSLQFERFVGRSAQFERKWPASFRTWFREKSGWIFERLSLGSKMKSGFDATVDADVEALLRPTLAEFSRRFLELTVRVDCSSASVLGCVEEITSDVLYASAQAIFTNSDTFKFPSTSSSELKLANGDAESDDAKNAADGGVLPTDTAKESTAGAVQNGSSDRNNNNNDSDNADNNDEKYVKSLTGRKREADEEGAKSVIEAEADDDDAEGGAEESVENADIKMEVEEGVANGSGSDPMTFFAEFDLHPAVRNVKMSRAEWIRCSGGDAKRRAVLETVGLSSLPLGDLLVDVKCGLHPNLFIGLDRSERNELLMKVYSLEVQRFTSSKQQSVEEVDENEKNFIVVDNAEKSCYFVSADYAQSRTYCQCQRQKISNFSTSIVKSLICEHLCATAVLADEPAFGGALFRSFSFSPSGSANGGGVANGSAENDNDAASSSVIGTEASNSFQLPNSPTVEIIHCSSRFSNDDAGDDSTNNQSASNVNGTAQSIFLENETNLDRFAQLFSNNNMALNLNNNNNNTAGSIIGSLLEKHLNNNNGGSLLLQ